MLADSFFLQMTVKKITLPTLLTMNTALHEYTHNSAKRFRLEDVILKLTAFAWSLASSLTWFRGPKTTSFLMGKEAEDYVYGAIGKYLEHPEKFDPSKEKRGMKNEKAFC